MRKRAFLQNQKGILALDFLFAFVILMSLTVLLLTVNFTLSVTETIQYAAFSSSRVYYGAHITPEKQKELAEKKFELLRERKVFGSFVKPEWFEMTASVGNHAENMPANRGNQHSFWGTRIDYIAKILSIRLPLIGLTGEEEEFAASVNSFLGREPSMSECSDANALRADAIQSLDSKYSSLGRFNYIPIGDNGC